MVIGGKKLVAEKWLKQFPNNERIHDERQKKLNVVNQFRPPNQQTTLKFEKPAPKGQVNWWMPTKLSMPDEIWYLLWA